MNIREIINTLLENTEEIKHFYPTVDNVRHFVKDIPYSELKEFAGQIRAKLHTDLTESRVFIIHSPMVDGVMDSDIWLYSTVIKIKPAEIIEE